MLHHRRAAFTLIELLVVIAVIAIIAAILFPVFARVREKARQASCISNEKQIATAVLVYMQDYDETFPFVLDASANFTGRNANTGDNGIFPAVPGVTGQERQFQLVTAVAPYVKNTNVWYCPSVGPNYAWVVQYQIGGFQKGALMRDQGTSYAYTYTAWRKGCWGCPGQILMGGKSYAILTDASRWPMLSDEPSGIGYTGSLIDPPSSAVPHSGGLNVAYGDGHAVFHRIEVADQNYVPDHAGDGVILGQ
jgi:prepilin-type N-terminal cleavage/methylation domain-containing protein/prepilin-type processing-associated H-X9-DG protein